MNLKESGAPPRKFSGVGPRLTLASQAIASLLESMRTLTCFLEKWLLPLLVVSLLEGALSGGPVSSSSVRDPGSAVFPTFSLTETSIDSRVMETP